MLLRNDIFLRSLFPTKTPEHSLDIINFYVFFFSSLFKVHMLHTHIHSRTGRKKINVEIQHLETEETNYKKRT